MAAIEHFALFAVDPAALTAFYCEALGLRVVLDNGAASPPGYFLADASGNALEIIGRPPGEPPLPTRYICHVAFRVDDVAKARADLEQRGLVFESETEVDTPAMKTVFCLDPEGNRLQLVWRARPLT